MTTWDYGQPRRQNVLLLLIENRVSGCKGLEGLRSRLPQLLLIGIMDNHRQGELPNLRAAGLQIGKEFAELRFHSRCRLILLHVFRPLLLPVGTERRHHGSHDVDHVLRSVKMRDLLRYKLPRIVRLNGPPFRADHAFSRQFPQTSQQIRRRRCRRVFERKHAGVMIADPQETTMTLNRGVRPKIPKIVEVFVVFKRHRIGDYRIVIQ